MNSVELTGRLVRDPDVRYTGSGMAIGRFTLAVDRQRAVKEGEASADFISICCFGKTAELMEKYVRKGRLIGISGRIQTGYYERENRKVYTTDIVANRVEFLSKNPEDASSKSGTAASLKAEAAAAERSAVAETAVSAEERSAIQEAVEDTREAEIPEGFEKLADDDIPF